MHDFGAGGCHFQHFVIGNFREFAGVGDDAWVAGVDAVDIGEDLADIGLEGGGDGDGGEVRAAAAEGVDHAVRGYALESGDDEGFFLVEEAAHE